jgi:hypothetical protein
MNLPGPTFTELLEAERDREDELEFRRLVCHGERACKRCTPAPRECRVCWRASKSHPHPHRTLSDALSSSLQRGRGPTSQRRASHYRHKYKEAPRKEGVIRGGQEMLVNQYFVTEISSDKAFIIAKLQEWEEPQADSDDSLCEKILAKAEAGTAYDVQE